MRPFRLRYYIREAFMSLRRSGYMAVVSSGVIALAVLALAGYWVGYQNTQALIERLGGRVEIVAFFKDGLSEEKVDQATLKIRALQGSRTVTLVSPEDARRQLEQDQELKRYLELLEVNPLPASVRISLENHTPELVRAYAARLAQVEGIDSVDYGDKAAETFLNVLRAARWLLLAAGGVLAASALLIVSNVIRLTVFARREEISIMQLVGASRLFIRAPYVLEGCLTGLLGGLAGASLLYALAEAAGRHLRENLHLDLTAYLRVGLDPWVLAGMVLLGVALGFGGSLAAVGKYLK